MNRSQLIDAMVDRGAGDRRHVSNMLKHLEGTVAEALADGEDVIIPGVVKLSWTYREPKKKGERWKKGDAVTGFGGVEVVKDEDSPAIKEKAGLKASVVGSTFKIRPKRDEVAQKEFFATKLGKKIRARKKKS